MGGFYKKQSNGNVNVKVNPGANCNKYIYTGSTKGENVEFVESDPTPISINVDTHNNTSQTDLYLINYKSNFSYNSTTGLYYYNSSITASEDYTISPGSSKNCNINGSHIFQDSKYKYNNKKGVFNNIKINPLVSVYIRRDNTRSYLNGKFIDFMGRDIAESVYLSDGSANTSTYGPTQGTLNYLHQYSNNSSSFFNGTSTKIYGNQYLSSDKTFNLYRNTSNCKFTVLSACWNLDSSGNEESPESVMKVLSTSTDSKYTSLKYLVKYKVHGYLTEGELYRVASGAKDKSISGSLYGRDPRFNIYIFGIYFDGSNRVAMTSQVKGISISTSEMDNIKYDSDKKSYYVESSCNETMFGSSTDVYKAIATGIRLYLSGNGKEYMIKEIGLLITLKVRNTSTMVPYPKLSRTAITIDAYV